MAGIPFKTEKKNLVNRHTLLRPKSSHKSVWNLQSPYVGPWISCIRTSTHYLTGRTCIGILHGGFAIHLRTPTKFTQISQISGQEGPTKITYQLGLPHKLKHSQQLRVSVHWSSLEAFIGHWCVMATALHMVIKSVQKTTNIDRHTLEEMYTNCCLGKELQF